MEVVFLDGKRVRASSIFQRNEDQGGRDFGLCLDDPRNRLAAVKHETPKTPGGRRSSDANFKLIRTDR